MVAVPVRWRSVVDRTRAASRRTVGRGTSSVAAGALVGGLSVYAFQVLGTRALGDEAFAPIGVLWTIQYLVLTVPMVAVEAYVTRSVTLDVHGDGMLPRRIRGVLAAWIGALAVALGGITWVWREPLFHGNPDLAAVAGLLGVSYGAFVVVRGWLAGNEHYRQYGAATAGESVIRLLLGALVLAAVAGTRPLAWILPVGPLAVAAWWVTGGRAPRLQHRTADRRNAHPGAHGEALGLDPPMPRASTGRFLALTTSANGAAQTLLAAGPLLLIPLGAPPGEVSVFFVTITAARVPLVFAFGGLLARLLPPLTHMARRGDRRALHRVGALMAGGTALTALVGAGAAALVGQDVVTLFFGEGFRPDGLFVTMTAAGVVLATGSLLLNQLLIAARAERYLPLPWFAGLAAALATVAVVDASATIRVVSGFLAGEVVAFLGLLAAVMLRAGSSRPSPPR